MCRPWVGRVLRPRPTVGLAAGLLVPCSPGFLTLRRSCLPSRPNLVSLDLGFNDLTDLQSMVASLRTLRHLRLLVLQGNPLALVPYYRGLTIDSLAQLCVLDDITVSPNEKHLFRGLSLNGGEVAGRQGGGGA